MKPIANWRAVLRYAWSVRLNALCAVLIGLDATIPYLEGVLPVPQGVFAAIAFAVAVGAMIARFIPQKTISGDEK